jgi:hypothetical protein
MSLSIQHVAVTTMTRGLKTLSAVIAKARDHVEAAGGDPETLVEARLAPDMLTLAGQVQRASDTAKGSVARLAGVDQPPFPDEEKTLADLQDRIARTLAFIDSVPASAFEGAETREIVLKFPQITLAFDGADYLLEFALPNFNFHVVTAYDILRHHGAPLDKPDFLALGAERIRTAA